MPSDLGTAVTCLALGSPGIVPSTASSPGGWAVDTLPPGTMEAQHPGSRGASERPGEAIRRIQVASGRSPSMKERTVLRTPWLMKTPTSGTPAEVPAGTPAEGPPAPATLGRGGAQVTSKLRDRLGRDVEGDGPRAAQAVEMRARPDAGAVTCHREVGQGRASHARLPFDPAATLPRIELKDTPAEV